MMTREERYKIHSVTYRFIIDNKLNSLPISIKKLCSILKVEELKPLSVFINDGFTKQDVFSIWKNEDGVLNAYKDGNDIYHLKIAYNDSVLEERQHFTLLEEFSHIILEHYKDPDFNMLKQQYDN